VPRIPRELAEVLIERRRKAGRLRDPADYAFGAQRKAVLDTAQMVACLCSGRAGKTRGFLLRAVRAMQEHPNSVIPYIALTRASAKRILWPQLVELNEQLQLGLTLNATDLTATAVNGAQIFCVGANRAEEIEKLRGVPMPLAGIDEAASFRGALLRYLIEDVLTPRLMDLRGQLWLVGTPGPVPAGFFYDVTTGAELGWSVHKWTVFDNPHLPHAKQWVDELIERRGWTWEHPTVRREYLGQWARDDSVLVYKYNPAINLVSAMPESYASLRNWSHVMGVDYGMVDECAWVVWAFQTRGPDQTSYAVHAQKEAGLLPDEAARVTADLIQRFDVVSTVGDAGGLGKPYIEEARRRFSLPIKNADKQQKLAHIELFNGDLQSQRIKLLCGCADPYADEMSTVQWEVSRVPVVSGGTIRHEDRRREDPRFPNHCCDAGLYGNRASTAYLNHEESRELPDPRDLMGMRALEQESRWLHAQRIEQQQSTWWDRD
jgi:hypothetical protein